MAIPSFSAQFETLVEKYQYTSEPHLKEGIDTARKILTDAPKTAEGALRALHTIEKILVPEKYDWMYPRFFHDVRRLLKDTKKKIRSEHSGELLAKETGSIKRTAGEAFHSEDVPTQPPAKRKEDEPHTFDVEMENAETAPEEAPPPPPPPPPQKKRPMPTNVTMRDALMTPSDVLTDNIHQLLSEKNEMETLIEIIGEHRDVLQSFDQLAADYDTFSKGELSRERLQQEYQALQEQISATKAQIFSLISPIRTKPFTARNSELHLENINKDSPAELLLDLTRRLAVYYGSKNIKDFEASHETVLELCKRFGSFVSPDLLKVDSGVEKALANSNPKTPPGEILTVAKNLKTLNDMIKKETTKCQLLQSERSLLQTLEDDIKELGEPFVSSTKERVQILEEAFSQLQKSPDEYLSIKAKQEPIFSGLRAELDAEKIKRATENMKSEMQAHRALEEVFPKEAEEVRQFILNNLETMVSELIHTGKTAKRTFPYAKDKLCRMKCRYRIDATGKREIQLLALSHLGQGCFTLVEKAAIIAGPMFEGYPHRVMAIAGATEPKGGYAASLKAEKQHRFEDEVLRSAQKALELIRKGVPHLLKPIIVSKLYDKEGTFVPVAKKVVMPICNEGTLKSYLKKNPTLSTKERLRFACTVLEALVQLHAIGENHLDVKEENMLLDKHGEKVDLYVTDFGECKATGETTENKAGTYPPPEAQEETSNQRTATIGPQIDMWAFGMMMFNILYVKDRDSAQKDNPILGVSIASTTAKDFIAPHQAVYATLDQKSKEHPETQPMNEFIKRLLSLEPSKRPTSEETLHAFEKFIQELK